MPLKPRIESVACIALLAMACAPPAPRDDSAVDRWLTCEECVNGELTAVRALGATALPRLRMAVDGAPASSIANIRASSVAAFNRARSYSLTLSPAERSLRPLGDSAAFVERNVQNFQSVFQMRAAQALVLMDPAGGRVRIRQSIARDDSAATKRFRADVRRYLDSLAAVP